MRVAWLLVLLGACPGNPPPSPVTDASERTASKPTASEPTPAPTLDVVQACIASARGDTGRSAILVRALCQEMTRSHTPGAVLAIATTDGPPLTIAAGVACLGQPGNVLPHTAFRLGSITKTLLAAAVVDAARRGLLELDASPASDLPGLAAPYRAVTWRQWLNHGSGLPDTAPGPQHAGLSDAELVAALTAAPPLAVPGAEHHYANAGYVLVGMALAHRTGVPSVELLRAMLATADTAAPAITADEQPAATTACGHLGTHPYSVRDDLALFAFGATWTFPAGGVVLSAPALAQAALRLAPTLQTDRTMPTATPPWHYALGLRRRRLPDGTKLWFHAGATGDFAADLHLLPDHGVAVVVLANAGTHLRASSFAALAHAHPGLNLGAGP